MPRNPVAAAMNAARRIAVAAARAVRQGRLVDRAKIAARFERIAVMLARKKDKDGK